MRRALSAILATAVLAGCGNDRTPVPNVRHADAPQGERRVRLKAAGIRFTAPGNWTGLPPEGQRVSGLQSNTATLAIWRYPRSEPLPEGDEQIQAAKSRLESRVRERDPTFELRSSEITRRGGAPAIELLGRQTIAGLPFEVRSSHIFAHGAEIVVDAYAPPEDFQRVDATVFKPVLESMRFDEPRGSGSPTPAPSASPSASATASPSPTFSPTPAPSPSPPATASPLPTTTPTATP